MCESCARGVYILNLECLTSGMTSNLFLDRNYYPNHWYLITETVGVPSETLVCDIIPGVNSSQWF